MGHVDIISIESMFSPCAFGESSCLRCIPRGWNRSLPTMALFVGDHDDICSSCSPPITFDVTVEGAQVFDGGVGVVFQLDWVCRSAPPGVAVSCFDVLRHLFCNYTGRTS